MATHIYLDHNASTPLRPQAHAAVLAALDVLGNPSSVHHFGRSARGIIERSRLRVAALAGVDPAAVVFTSGATEANALALTGCRRRATFVSAIEHASVRDSVPSATPIPVDAHGRVDAAALDDLLARCTEPALVSVMTANNETGVVQPLAEIVEVAHRHGAIVHSDAAQAPGRLPLAAVTRGVDLLSLSAHKCGGPPGVGALIAGTEVAPQALLKGGGQERGRRAGTENLPGIAGFGAAADLAAELDDCRRLAVLRDRLEAGLRAVCPEVRVFGAGAERLPNTSCFAMPGAGGDFVAADTQVIAFDLAGIAVSAGAACSSGKVSRSTVLAAMGVPAAEAASAIRVSLGWTTAAADIERFLEAWVAIRRRCLHARAAALV